MKNLNIKYVQMETTTGAKISDIIREARIYASKNKVNVKFKHNTRTFEVYYLGTLNKTLEISEQIKE